MTGEICSTEAYARSTEATVAAVLPEGLMLDRTVFFSRGGGQPGDTGWLRWEGGKVRVMDPPAARMDFELDGITAEFGREVEARLNEALAADRPVRVLFLPRAEALADPDLIRTKVNLIPERVDPIRVIDIDGIDRQADGGTHVRSTGEVGPVRVVKTESKGRAFKRMRIELEG
jgi:Ser-tRNA(Ala) deacylase AlaX